MSAIYCLGFCHKGGFLKVAAQCIEVEPEAGQPVKILPPVEQVCSYVSSDLGYDATDSPE